MAVNIEIQAHAGDLITPAKRVAEVATTGLAEISKDDTFFPLQLGQTEAEDILKR